MSDRLRPTRIVAVAVALAALVITPIAAPAALGAPGPQETETGEAAAERLEERIEELESELERLRDEVDGEASPEASERTDRADPVDRADRMSELERRIEALAAELERLRLGEAVSADEIEKGYGPAASKIYRTEQGLSIGGYGEVVYENFDSERDDGSPAGADDTFDALRGILYFGYKFTDRWLFNSEIELEHADEAFLEFAYIDYLWRPELGFRGGLLLIPMGLVNELHEPTIFLGANRPVVESVIIPTTWRENGLGIHGETGVLAYRAYVVNGLEGADFSAGGLRGGRQKGSKAKAEDLALVARLDVSPAPGLLVGGSAYRGDSGQDLEGGSIDLTTTIVEAHLDWRWRGLQTRALWTQAELDDVAALNAALGLTGPSSVGETLSGYYVQVGYDVLSRIGSRAQLTPFVRYSQVDTQDEVPAGFSADPATDREILTLGLDFKPIDQVVIKVDWQDVDNEAGTGLDQFNVALGYVF